MRRFNTAGPCEPELHYMVPAESRLPEARPLVEQGAYFVVHAPRQTGKTTATRALARTLTRAGRFAALHFSCEAARVSKDIGAAEQVLLTVIRSRAASDLRLELQPAAGWPAPAPPGICLHQALTAWAQACPRPLALIFDEVDSLEGDVLRSVLSQLRAGFSERPRSFPAAVVLCGMRDVRDYKIQSGGGELRAGTSSPFNIMIKSLRIGNLTGAEVRELYGQHTAETGQAFTDDALRRGLELTGGQPWLVNALAREVVDEMRIAPPTPIEVAHLDAAKERLILARQTHLDSLVARLQEPRVRRVIEPLIAGTFGGDATYDDDVSYAVDLGLVVARPMLAVANPIYREVIVRVLGTAAESQVDVPPTTTFVGPDGRLDVRAILGQFAAFWREHGEALVGRMPYHEVAPQLVLMAYLQRVVNGGGFIDREYGVGRGRIDLLIRWPVGSAWQREAIELKVWSSGRPDPVAQGLVQLDGYLAQVGLDHGMLVVFDRRSEALPPQERTRWQDVASTAGHSVTVLRL